MGSFHCGLRRAVHSGEVSSPMRFPIHRGLRDTGRAGALSPLKTGSRLAAAAAALLLAACARESHDGTIARYTRAYVSGHITFQRYRELCVALNGERTYPSRGSVGTDNSSSDTNNSSSDTTEQDNRHEKEKRDKQHADTHHPKPPPPPAGTVAPQPPPPPRDTR